VRARGDFDVVNRDMARRHAEHSPAELVAQLREHAGSRRKPAITTYRNLLFDVLVHSQDIAVPLGRPFDLSPDAAAVATTRVLSMRWPPPLPSARKLAGFRLVATDIAWSHGAGPEIVAPIGALLLLACGRLAVALPQLAGTGAADLTARLATPA
jgi:uncharacterized protein (TIGR03083 family)